MMASSLSRTCRINTSLCVNLPFAKLSTSLSKGERLRHVQADARSVFFMHREILTPRVLRTGQRAVKSCDRLSNLYRGRLRAPKPIALKSYLWYTI